MTTTYTQPIAYDADVRYDQPGLHYDGPIMKSSPADGALIVRVGPLRLLKRVFT